ncbi:sensor histidine kinase [Olivibacter domesticus]|uniref:Histidine kinase n=1 Tax=Olivibacter domesticus TaxID=407022 RepID=A0A1H7K2Y3_OLID1|nr:histidine kinase [Olivibacter domesticus]SEK81218.1 Histidine kinase [Olivibacter domesticus]
MKDTSSRQNWFVDFLVADKYRFYRHLLIWIYIILTEIPNFNGTKTYAGNYDIYYGATKLLLFIPMVYVNMYILVPKLLFKDRYFVYLFTILTMILIMISITQVLSNSIFDHFFSTYRLTSDQENYGALATIIDNLNILGIAVIASTSIKLLQRWKKDSTRINDLEKNTLQIELRELKNQINPHFLFNMLNNVNVLVSKDPAKASMIIKKLSQFLRYQLYETRGQAVSLHSEMAFLQDFLELEKIRRDEFSFKIDNEQPAEVLNVFLPPGLFLTFVENAVKHSADAEAPSSISLGFKNAEKSLIFTCVNTKPIEPSFAHVGGLGLANIIRRLDLLYGKSYKLDVQNEEDLYKVSLSIPI